MSEFNDGADKRRRLYYNTLPNVIARIAINLVLAPLCVCYLCRFLGIGAGMGVMRTWLAWICLYFVVKGVVLNVTVTWNYWQRRFY